MDNQPPKKKSRFFCEGLESRVNGSSTSSKTNQRAPQSTTSDPSSLTSYVQQHGQPSTLPPSAQPGFMHKIPTTTHLPTARPSNQQIPQPWPGTENSGLQIQPKPYTNPPDLQNYSVRNHRRDGIYGVESLMPVSVQPAANSHAQHESLGMLYPSFPIPPVMPTNIGNSSQQVGLASIVPHMTYSSAQSGRNQQGRRISERQHDPGFAPMKTLHQTLYISQPTSDSGRQIFTPQKHLNRANQTGKSLAHLEPQLVDLDRDSTGRLMLPMPQLPTTNVVRNNDGLDANMSEPPAKRRCSPQIPANQLTSPNRIAHATAAARSALKRKRPAPILPPPAYIYSRTNAPNFNVFQGILLYPELVFALAAQLPINSLVSLYAISRDFHTIIDTRFTTVILSQSVSKAPQSSRTFTFRCYAKLCRIDPAARIPHPDPQKESKVRSIPSFRWLRMVLYREKVVHEIMTLFAEDGVPLPARCSLAIKRLWFLLDIPDNARRIGFIHVEQLFSDLDLYFAMCFFVKLDMRFNDPVSPEKRDGLRKMLLSQTSFTTLHQVLIGEIWQTRHEILREWVKWKYELGPDEQDVESVFGVPKDELGKLKLEHWGRRGHADGSTSRMLLRPDQLVMREAIRRGLRFTKHFQRCMLYGYIRPDILENYAPRGYGRRIANLKYEEYGVDDTVGNVAPLAAEAGGDRLLDLGRRQEASVLTVAEEKPTQEELERREKFDEFVKRCMVWSEVERADLVQDDETGMNA